MSSGIISQNILDNRIHTTDVDSWSENEEETSDIDTENTADQELVASLLSCNGDIQLPELSNKIHQHKKRSVFAFTGRWWSKAEENHQNKQENSCIKQVEAIDEAVEDANAENVVLDTKTGMNTTTLDEVTKSPSQYCLLKVINLKYGK